ncbi:variant surface glycoprotein (VSG), putative [Trypanosoma brucei brucei TREU927]|uniref:Variant surface glycoprotein (VSG), putative n=1 Tax=Trypanosoma brucei brucei (strain 927/4 GUTat10.1) TaxID=185431 RepID=Q4GY52_TRYB2|nr:variant surface glycoprotein (VSG), putative [Trypanosoma brucei brucei TREU927]CAJ16737.1 variant surface glycoprotein (VSG), putative [Trypanosoma brucei brucei TREU927]
MTLPQQVLIGIMVLSTSRRAQTEKPADDAACANLCACIARTHKRLNLYEITYASAASQQRSNHENYNKLIVAATVGDANLKRKLVPVIAAGGEILEECADLPDKLQKQTKDLTEGVNQLTRSWKIMDAMTATSRRFKVTATGGTPFAQLPTPSALAARDDKPCPSLTDSEDLLQIDKATEAKQPALPEQAYALKVVYKCTHNGAASCHSTQIAENGFVELELTGGPAQNQGTAASRLGTSLENGINLEVTPLKITGDLLKKVNANFTAAKQLLQNQSCSKDLREYSALSGTQVFGKLATKALLRLYDKESIDTGDQQAQAATKDAYGQTGEKLATNVWQLVDDIKVPVTGDGKEQNTALNSVTTMRQLGDSVARLLLKELKSEEEKETKNKNAEEEQNKECSDKNGTDCTRICVMVEGVCTPKKKGEDENKEKTGTTNTTGSNSFVIKKAPLWLAFFILACDF